MQEFAKIIEAVGHEPLGLLSLAFLILGSIAYRLVKAMRKPTPTEAAVLLAIMRDSVFGARNRRMAQDFANLVGGVAPEDIQNLASDEQVLLIEGKALRCRQVRYYEDRGLAACAD